MCAVKDRYGDRADDSESESSESSSDDTEVVRIAAVSFPHCVIRYHCSHQSDLCLPPAGTGPCSRAGFLQNFVPAEEERPEDLRERCKVLLTRWLMQTVTNCSVLSDLKRRWTGNENIPGSCRYLQTLPNYSIYFMLGCPVWKCDAGVSISGILFNE